MSRNFWYQPFVAVCGNLVGKVPVVDDVLSSHEHELYPTTSLDENCMEFEYQTDRNYYVDLRQTYLAVKPEFVKSRGFETYNSKEVKTRAQRTGKVDVGTEEEQEAPVPLFTHVNNILYSVFSNGEVYINNQQIYKSKGLYAYNSYNSNNLKVAISEHKTVLHC